MEDSGGGLQDGGGYWRQIYIWRPVSEGIVIDNAILQGCPEPLSNREADFGGRLQYGGGF